MFPLSGFRPGLRARRLRKERHKGSAKTVAHQQKGQLMQRCGDEETDTEEQGNDAQKDLRQRCPVDAAYERQNFLLVLYVFHVWVDGNGNYDGVI